MRKRYLSGFIKSSPDIPKLASSLRFDYVIAQKQKFIDEHQMMVNLYGAENVIIYFDIDPDICFFKIRELGTWNTYIVYDKRLM